MKSMFKYQILEEIAVAPMPVNEGVIWDKKTA
jgi:hypothetical protein